MVDITIDGQAISAEKGETIIQVAKKNGIKIPHLCYHPALKPSGACKLCGVEVISHSGKAVVMLSCILKVKPGLEVKTDTPLVQKARTKAFNKLLQMAPDAERIRGIARKFNVEVTPPPDGCIQCRLCIRVCNDIVKAKALKMISDESGKRVVADPSLCIGCGTCANICPTHVITATDKDSMRSIAIKGEVFCQLPLERCEGCGRRYATTRFLDHVEDVTISQPHVKEHHNYCPNCVRMLSDKALTERTHMTKRVR